MCLVRSLVTCCALGLLAAGCGGAVDKQLTPEEIAKQRAADKADLDHEDKVEREYQQKQRQQGS
jgi:hypothetical protein